MMSSTELCRTRTKVTSPRKNTAGRTVRATTKKTSPNGDRWATRARATRVLDSAPTYRAVRPLPSLTATARAVCRVKCSVVRACMNACRCSGWLAGPVRSTDMVAHLLVVTNASGCGGDDRGPGVPRAFRRRRPRPLGPRTWSASQGPGCGDGGPDGGLARFGGGGFGGHEAHRAGVRRWWGCLLDLEERAEGRGGQGGVLLGPGQCVPPGGLPGRGGDRCQVADHQLEPVDPGAVTAGDDRGRGHLSGPGRAVEADGEPGSGDIGDRAPAGLAGLPVLVQLQAAGGAAGRLDALGVQGGQDLVEGAPAAVQGLRRGGSAGLDPQLEQRGVGHGRGHARPGHGHGPLAARGELRVGHVGSSHSRPEVVAPSTWRAVPLTNRAGSEQRKHTILPKSAGSPTGPSPRRPACLARSVSWVPGQARFRVMPSSNRSAAAVLAQAHRPVRAVLDRARVGIGSFTALEVIRQMRPQPAARIAGRAARTRRMEVSRLAWRAAWSR